MPKIGRQETKVFHLSDRELFLLGQPTRTQTLELVGWMSLNNIFGHVTDSVCRGDELPSEQTAQWIGGLTGVTGYRGAKGDQHRKKRQRVLPNGRRRVRATVATNGGLSTGNN
jgi:hypothetical protein